jgi:hypothetical protein
MQNNYESCTVPTPSIYLLTLSGTKVAETHLDNKCFRTKFTASESGLSSKSESPIINIVHFAEQEDDSDLEESPDSEAVNLVRKHLLSKCVSATLVPDNVRR